jgi:hypothetical protein
MQPPLSSTSITDPTSTDFAFPTPTDHPASVDLDRPPARQAADHGNGVKHRHSLGHRPHLRIPHHRRHLHTALGDDEPESAEGTRGAELLKVPKTREPHARSLDTTTGGLAHVNGGKDGQKNSKRDERMNEDKDRGMKKAKAEVDSYESPVTPRPEPVSTVPQPIKPAAQSQPEKSKDVWTEIREERSKTGVTPLYVPASTDLPQSL